MSIKPFKIAPIETGVQNNIEPWLLPEDAYQYLEDAYVWRGRVKKRFGYYNIGGTALSSRLRVNIGTTDGSGDLGATTVPGTVFEIGQMFSVGSVIFTVKETGTPGTLLATSGSGTYNTTTGSVTITGATPTTNVYFYPSTPVMALARREQEALSYELIVAFDQQFSYQRSGGFWERITAEAVAGDAIWTGTDSDFYWSCNYRGSTPDLTFLYVVNYVQADGIRYLDNTTTWNTITPDLVSGGARTLDSALILVGFKDRLVALNTIESDGTYANRARFSQNGSPLTTDAWYDTVKGKGGYIDAYTQESIVTCEIVKDRLIVYFERSTWELVYTGNETLPFRWAQMNSELGAESTHSIIGFDKMAVGVGNVGIHACNGVNVERIDEKIPDEVFKIHNTSEGPKRVYGIRDYYRELVYWTFPNENTNPTYPNRILVWNYINNTWSFFNDSFTCFGYFQRDSVLTWADLGGTYGTWEGWSGTWQGVQAQKQFPNIVAGNQEGFVFVIDGDRSYNTEALYITNMDTAAQSLTVINHNLNDGDYVAISSANGITITDDIETFKVRVIDSDTLQIDYDSKPDFIWTGTYTGGGYLTKISNINITSKQWNPGTDIGVQFLFPYIDFLVNNTDDGDGSGGEVTIEYFTDFNEDSSIQDGNMDTGATLGTNALITYPENTVFNQANQRMIWHRYFIGTLGQTIQIKIFMSNEQMRDLTIAQQDFVLNGLVLYIQTRGRLIQ